jgi:Photosynthesis system II assembly factor YCF48
MPSDDRDQQLDRALARHLGSVSPDTACPDAEILAAYHERSLSLEEMAHWKTHIASCSRCQETLALLEQTDSVAANDWEKQELPGDLTGGGGIKKEENVPARFAAGAAPVPAALPMTAKVLVKTRHRVPWNIIIPAGMLAAGLLVWVAVRDNSQYSRQEKAPVQVAENREASSPSSNAIPEAGKTEARDEGSAALQSKSPAERVSTGPVTTPAPPAIAMPSIRRVAPPPAPQNLAKPEKDNSASLDASKSAYAYRAKATEGVVGGRRAAAPAAPQAGPGQAGGPLISNQEQNQMQNQTADQYSNQVVTPPANQRIGQVSEQVTVEAEKKPATQDKKGAQKELKQKNETVAVSAATETVEVTSAPPASATVAFSPASLNGKAALLWSYQGGAIIASRDQKHLWRVGPAGKIEISGDAGKTWKPQSSGVTADLLAGSAPSEKVCWIAGKAGTLLRTTDAGKHWKQIASPIADDIGGVNAVNAQDASIWDLPNSKRFETSDGGLTWKQVANQ